MNEDVKELSKKVDEVWKKARPTKNEPMLIIAIQRAVFWGTFLALAMGCMSCQSPINDEPYVCKMCVDLEGRAA
jgi:hypothetical protein